MASKRTAASRQAISPFRRVWDKALCRYLAERVNTRTRGRAFEYTSRASIRQARVEGEDLVTSLIQGSDVEPYVTEMTVTPQGDLGTLCSCPVEIDCKHATALALLLAFEGYRRGDADCRQAAEFFPASWLKDAPPDPDLIVGIDTLFRAGDSEPKKSHAGTGEKPKTKTRKKPKPEGLPWWRQFLEAPDRVTRIGILRKAVQDRARSSSWATEAIVGRLSAFENPLDVLRQFDPVIEAQKSYYYLRDLQPRDPELQAFLQSDEFRELAREMERRVAEERLMDWLNEPAAGEPLRPEVMLSQLRVEWVTRPLQAGISGLLFRVLIQKQRGGFTARKAQSLITVAHEVRNRFRAFEPVQQRFISWVADRPEVYHSRYGSHSDEPGYDPTLFPLPDVFAWIAMWGDAQLVRWEDGGPVKLVPARAVLTLAPNETGQVRWVVRAAPFGDLPGEEVELAKATLLVEMESWTRPRGSTPRIFLRQGDTFRLVETYGMPLDVLAAARILNEVPVKRIAESPAGIRLARRLSLTDSSASAFMEEVPVEPVVEFRMEDGVVSMAAWARAQADGRRFVRRAPGQWEPVPDGEAPQAGAGEGEQEPLQVMPELPPPGGKTVADGEGGAVGGESAAGEAAPEAEAQPPAPSPAAVLARLPRRSDVEPVEQWLESLLPSDVIPSAVPGPMPRMTWKLTPSAHVRLLEVWPVRPTRVTYLGDKEFRDLVEIRKVPRFSISVEPSGIDWLKVSIDVEQELESLSFNEVAAMLASSQSDLVVLKGGRVFRRSELEEWRDQVESLSALGISGEAGEQRLHALHLAGAPAGTLESLGRVSPDLHRLADSARALLASFKGVPEAPVAPETAAFLRPYQRTGADFLTWACQTFGGAVLADDMGLGKTLQVLAALTALRAAGEEALPALVICPASVAHNWQREAARFAPALRVAVLESGKERQELLGRLGDFDLVVINYALVRRDIKALARQSWMAVVVDEAQAIKNPQAEISRAVKVLDARHRIALTGTPIENRILDLWSIVDFALPGYLGRLDPAQAASADPATAARFYVLLRARLRPVLLRRVKAEVAPELPERIEARIDCVMETKQQKVYLAELKRARLMLQGTGGEVKGRHRIQILAALTRLRQICCAPALVGYSEAPSAKVEQLLELLGPILESGHKVLVFSQFVRMLERLRTRLKAEGIPTHMLTGQSTRRSEIVDAFEHDPTPSVFLISLKAGGTGLNLTSASHVILFDPWWNPAVEAQAIDRTHRIGQDKTVLACRLVTEQTIEERILELQERKRALVKNVLEEETFNRTLTREDFEFLLGTEE